MTLTHTVEKVRRRASEEAARARQWAVERGALPGHTEYRRFIVLCTIRTGSTMLGSYLGSHPNARMFFEVFHRHAGSVPFGHPGYDARANAPAVVADRNGDPAGFLERHVFTRQPTDVQAVGFKLLYTQARQGRQWWDEPAFDHWWAHLDRSEEPDWDTARSDLWASLAADRDLAVIHLTRENPLAGIVSASLAKQTGRWGIGATGGVGVETVRTTVEVDTRHLLQNLDAGRRQQREAEALFQGHPLTHVTYEQLVSTPDETLARLQSFLGMPAATLQTRTEKQNRRPLAEVVENHAAVAQALDGTRWESLLTDG